jgi:hypothetical protein
MDMLLFRELAIAGGLIACLLLTFDYLLTQEHRDE